MIVEIINQCLKQLIDQVETFEIEFNHRSLMIDNEDTEMMEAHIQNAERLCRMYNICLNINVEVVRNKEYFYNSMFYKNVLEEYDNSSVEGVQLTIKSLSLS